MTPTRKNGPYELEMVSGRFDTIFYTAQLDEIPSALQDQTEVELLKPSYFCRNLFSHILKVTAVKWEEPSALLSDCRDHSIWLAPPQVSA